MAPLINQTSRALKDQPMEPNTQVVEPKIIDAPIAPAPGGVIYQVTLASGAVLTNPAAFPDGPATNAEVNPYLADDGRLLVSEHRLYY